MRRIKHQDNLDEQERTRIQNDKIRESNDEWISKNKEDWIQKI